jgi:perosamine synthetase
MKLAINGGDPVRKELFPAYNTIGEEEKKEVMRVLDSGILSRFMGCWNENFYGGPEVQALEREWATFYNVKHAISVNSATSALYCAVGATGIEPGEEVIVSPYTMCASATAPLVYNGIPVFADIEEDYFCLDSESIQSKITSKTRAIIVVDIMGLPYDADTINEIAKKNNLLVIEDCAQAPFAKYKGKYAGTLGDIGVFSLNYHKHIHCGEGGIIVTDDDALAEKMRLIRNHAEAVVEMKGFDDLTNMIGFNYRMTELEAAVARCQLRKLEKVILERRENCEYLSKKLSEIPAIVSPSLRDECTHSFYVHPFKFNETIAGVSRDKFINAVKTELPATKTREGEGPLISYGFTKPLYLQPIFQNKIAFGSKGFPFTKSPSSNYPNYNKGICPVAERMYEKEFFHHQLMTPGMYKRDLDDVAEAFLKVWDLRRSI